MIDKIVYLSGSVLPSTAANSVHVMKMCQALAKQAGTVELVARTYERAVDVPAIQARYGVTPTFALKLVLAPKIRGASILTAPAVWSHLRNERAQIDLILARDHIGALVAMQLGIPVIFESHGLPTPGYIRQIERRLFEHAKLLKLVVISQALKKLYEDSFDVLPKNIEVHHDAADVPDGDENTIPDTRTDRPLRVGYIGHLYNGRGIDVILAAATQLREYEFHIYGGIPKDIAFWKKQSPPNVIFHGHIEPAMTQAARTACDILVMPYQENLSVAGRKVDTSIWMSPMKLFEYMSARRPIISSDLPVLREVLNDENAILAAPHDENAWIQALRRLSDPSERAKLAAQAYCDFIKNYTWDKRAANILGNIELLTD